MIVPDDLRRTIVGWAGVPGEAWLASLPSLVGDLAAEWCLDVGEPYVPSGYTALALRVRCADGTPAVLKLRCPDELDHEVDALRHYGGGASVELLGYDAERCALLLERCDPGTPLLGEPDDVATSVVAETVGALWARPAEGHPFRTLAESAARWTATISRAGDIGVDAALRDETLALLAWLVEDPPAPVVLHGDLHPGNVLRATRRSWLAIDPKGVVGDPSYDVASVIRDKVTPENVRRRFDIVTEMLPVDPARARAWTLAICVESAAWSAEVGDVEAAAYYSYAAPIVASLPG